MALPPGFSAQPSATGRGDALFEEGVWDRAVSPPPSSVLRAQRGQLGLGVRVGQEGGLLVFSQKVHARLNKCVATLAGFSVSGFKLVGRGYSVTAFAGRRCLVLSWVGQEKGSPAASKR